VYPRLWLSSFNRRWHGGEIGIADALLGAAREIFADHEDPSRVWITDSLFPERSPAQMADAPHHGWYLLRGPHTRDENGELQGTYIRFATERPKGFRGVLPRRWVAERTFSWFGQSRRLSRDYERIPLTRAAMIHATISRTMLKRLVRSSPFQTVSSVRMAVLLTHHFRQIDDENGANTPPGP
jgi:transposase